MKKAVITLSHFFFWTLNFLASAGLFSMVYSVICFHLQYPDGAPHGSYGIEDDYRASLIIVAMGACIFYASYFSLQFFLKKPLRSLWLLGFYAGYSLLVSLPADFVSASATFELGFVLYFNLAGFLFRACEEWFNDRQLKAALEMDRMASQLELLKSKLDPHFLFNNLNNIDVFIQEDPPMASEYLRKLSDILRYMLYEAGDGKVLLLKEMEYIGKYVDLQKIRTANARFVKLETVGDPGRQMISPMLLIHFVENAFKFAANKKVDAAVEIRFNIEQGRLLFYCKNHISEASAGESEMKGLGMQLLVKKLDLIYKKEYKLNTGIENNWYIVRLQIPLDED